MEPAQDRKGRGLEGRPIGLAEAQSNPNREVRETEG